MIELTVCGTPGPQGSKRHVGNGVMIESSAKVKPWREAVKWAYIEQQPRWSARQGIRGPVAVEMIFTLPKPKSAPKRMQTWPDRRPDLDKLIRSTFDALTSVGAFDDDARVIRLSASKVYTSEGVDAMAVPGAVIRISSAGPQQERLA